MQKVNWGIIGLGSVAKEFAEGFKYTENANLLSLASKDPKKIDAFKKAYHIKDNYCFSSYQELIELEEVDIIYIALPTFLHKEWIIKCLNANKKVLVEKPATMNADEILSVKKILNKKTFFVEAFMYLFHPQIKKTIDLIKQEEIGELISMKSNFGKNLMTKKNWLGFTKKKKIDPSKRIYNKNMGGGSILDLGCYPVSFSVKIASILNSISFDNVNLSKKQLTYGPTEVEVDSYVDLKFNNGFSSTIGASFSKNLGNKTQINGKKGQIIIEDTWTGNPSRIILKKNNSEKVFDIDTKKNIYSYEISALSEHIRSLNFNNYTGLTIDETVINMKIIDSWKN